MSKKISVKLAILALFLLSAAPLIAVVNLELCTKGQVQYQPKGDCETSSRTCCEGGIWSKWGGDCKDLTWTWNCRQVPKSYCTGTGKLLLSTASGSISGQTCTTYGKDGFSSGTTDGNPALASGANTACYQCKCGGIPTDPACNCSGSSVGTCQAIINGMAYVGQRKCLAGCLWDDCYSVESPEGEYCGLTPGKTYGCTPAAYPEHGGYQVCESSYTDPGQLQISSCKACGENACLARIGGVGLSNSGSYHCVNKPTGGSDTKGKYTCTAAKCSSMGISSNPWSCTAKTYTSCNSGYTLNGGACISDEGGGTLKPIDPLKPLEPLR